MSKKNKVLYSIIAIVFSFLAAGIGFGIVGSSEMKFSVRFFCDFVFAMQAIGTVWIVVACFRTE